MGSRSDVGRLRIWSQRCPLESSCDTLELRLQEIPMELVLPSELRPKHTDSTQESFQAIS